MSTPVQRKKRACQSPTTTFTLSDQIRIECSRRKRISSPTVFATAFSPSFSSGEGDECGRYLVACVSAGILLIWDLYQTQSNGTRIVDNAEKDSDLNYKKVMDHDPIIRFKVCDGVLYDVQFIKSSNTYMLVTCGEGGAYLFQWCKILERLSDSICAERLSMPAIEELTPSSTFRTNPALFAAPIEMNGIAYDEALRRLYCAAGDLFGGYIWDIESNKRVGTLGNGYPLQPGEKPLSRHSNYLHTIKTVPRSCANPSAHTVLTGGEDGQVGIWDGKELKLIQMIDFNTVMKGTIGEQTSFWVSSMDVQETGNWAAVGGGIDYLSYSGKCNNSNEFGFMASLNLPTRTVGATKRTREVVNNIAYHSRNGYMVSVGNESVVSYWNQSDITRGREGRTLLTSSSAYSISIHPNGELMAVAGVGQTVDCLSDKATRFSLKY